MCLYDEIKEALSKAESPDLVITNTDEPATLFDLIDCDETDGSHDRMLDSATEAVLTLLLKKNIITQEQAYGYRN